MLALYLLALQLVDGSLESTCRVLLKRNLTSFYSARNARIASAVLSTAIPSVCPSVCLSVTRRYCVKTTARSTVQFAPLDSKMFVETKKYSPGTTLPLKFWLQVTYPLLKTASFDTFCLVAPQP